MLISKVVSIEHLFTVSCVMHGYCQHVFKCLSCALDCFSLTSIGTLLVLCCSLLWFVL